MLRDGCRLASLFTAFVVDAALPLPVPEIGLSGRDRADCASKASAAGREGALCPLCELRAAAVFDVGGAKSPHASAVPSQERLGPNQRRQRGNDHSSGIRRHLAT
jgi:hypothetical protein